jgi:hypothetical protein
MLREAKAIYLATRKRHDQLFNTYCMRPIAAVLVAGVARTRLTPNQLTFASVALFAVAAVLFVMQPDYAGGLYAVAVVELSYLCDCADGMLARHRKTASQQGHLLDFFTDETKAVMLVGALGLRLWRTGGWGIDGRAWPAGSPWFLVAGIAAVAVIASATSLTNFVRRPEVSGRETPVAAHYETEAGSPERRGVRRLAGCALDLLRLCNHYPSHLYLFAIAGRLELFFWLYGAVNLLYLGRGWLGLAWRFGRCG